MHAKLLQKFHDVDLLRHMANPSGHIELVEYTKVLLQWPLRHIELRREPHLVLLVKLPAHSHAQVVIHMVAQFNVGTIRTTLVQVAPLGVDDLKSIVQTADLLLRQTA